MAIFFVISGFVLYRPFAGRLDGRRCRCWAATRARALRIVPAYWLALTVSAIALGLAGVLTHRLVTYYGFGQIYSQDTLTGGLVQAWTLCVEVTFYAFLPCGRGCCGGARRPRAILRREALAGLAAASLAWKAAFGGAGRRSQVVDRRGCTRCRRTSTSSRSGWGWRC